MKFKNLAVMAAKRSGRIHKKYFNSKIKIRKKSTSFDLLTWADVESEDAIASLIKKFFPEHNILAEEHKYQKTNSPYTWIIDPLDGTNNFACGLPIFCTSIALAKNKNVILGVVYDVTRGELFLAQKGKGAFLNNKRIRVSKSKALSESILVTGFYYDRGKNMIETLSNMRKFFKKRILGLRRLGAAALDLAYIASGRVSGFWEFSLSPWDFAAGKLLVQEAGGKVTDQKGKKVDIYNNSYIVASNGKIHSKILAVVK